MSKVCKNYTLGINKFNPHTKNAFEFKQTKIYPLFVLKFHQLFKLCLVKFARKSTLNRAFTKVMSKNL